MRPTNFLVPLSLIAQALSGPTPVNRSNAGLQRRARPGFASTNNGDFRVDGKRYAFASTNAYWLSQLSSEDDIRTALVDIAAQNSRVVRTWCFREVVGARPSDPATYTAVWQNGKQILNQRGLDRILFILDQADSLGMKVQCALTNNWAPNYPSDAPKPLGFFPNSYGGTDTYVQQLKPGGHHDEFFSDAGIKAHYKVFLNWIVSALKDKSSLFAWELINDPQCFGATGTTTSNNCKTTTITSWVNELSSFVKSIDPDHLVTAGDHGFFCTIPSSCPKINPVHHTRATRRVQGRRGLYLTVEDIEDRRRTDTIQADDNANDRRDKSPVGAAFDGSYGVDSEDIMNSLNIDFVSFQLFPDQHTYGNSPSRGPPVGGAGGANFNATLKESADWINLHADSAEGFGKALSMIAYGIVSQDDAANFEPFDSTTFGAESSSSKRAIKKRVPDTMVTAEGKENYINMQANMAANRTANPGADGESVNFGTAMKRSISRRATSITANGSSPNDGYANASKKLKAIFAAVGAKQNAKT